jgi:hypothetical protein
MDGHTPGGNRNGRRPTLNLMQFETDSIFVEQTAAERCLRLQLKGSRRLDEPLPAAGGSL